MKFALTSTDSLPEHRDTQEIVRRLSETGIEISFADAYMAWRSVSATYATVRKDLPEKDDTLVMLVRSYCDKAA